MNRSILHWVTISFFIGANNCAFSAPPLRLFSSVTPANSAAAGDTQAVFQSWQTEQGLPQNSVRSIVQTPDGYLWLSTQEGLVRFDGTRFTILDDSNSKLPANDVSPILVAQDSGLWIGTTRGLARYSHGTITLDPSFPTDEPVSALRSGGGDTILAGTSKTLYSIVHGNVRKYLLKDGFLPGRISSIDIDREGRVWIGTSKGVYSLENGILVPGPGDLAELSIACLACTPDGMIWAGTEGRGVVRIRGSQAEFIRARTKGLATDYIRSMMSMGDGTLWVGTDGGGLHRFTGNEFSVFGGREFAGDAILSLCNDREGNMWIGTYSGGLFRMKHSAFSMPCLDRELSTRNISCILEDTHRRVWVGTVGGALNNIEDGHVHRFYGPKGNFVRVLYEDRKGNIWIGTSDTGVACFDGKQFRWYSRRDGLGSDWITAITEDSEGRLLVATRTGELQEIQNGRCIPYMGPGFKPVEAVTNLHRSPDGTLWIAAQGPLLYRLRGSSWHVFTQSTGLTRARIQGLSDGDGSLWIVTGGEGIQLLDDTTFHTVTGREGLFDNTIHCLVDDGAGNYWMSSNHGIASVPKMQMENLIAGKIASIGCRTFDATDGMPSRECNGSNQPAAWRMRNGTIWFPTVKGIAVVDPGKVPRNDLPPIINFEEVRVNRERVNPLTNIVAPPGGGNLEFHFVAISLTAPEKVFFKYMLVGYDEDWVDASDRHAAYYTNISPGSYRFRVIARNNDGVWTTDEGATVFLTLEPHFYQTMPFYALLFILTISIGAGIQIFFKRYKDRGRIATELKSQLALTQLQMLRSQLKPHFLFNTLNAILVYIKEDPHTAATMVEQLSRLLRVATDSLQRQEITLREEVALLDAYLGILQIRFEDRLRVERKIEPGTEDGLVPTLFLQPLVENAITHGFARTVGEWHIEISAKRNNGLLDISIGDNGSGFPDAKSRALDNAGGVGLKNTRARLEYLYGAQGNLHLSNRTESGGATVHLVLPFHTSSSEFGGNTES